MRELQLDGLPGPSHFYGGLSQGNLASEHHGGQRSQPRAAARQCLAKMRIVLDLGYPVAFLPPLPRPDFALLNECGFTGNPRGVLVRAEADAPDLVRWAWSSAAMWTANAATVAPGIDSDGTTRLLPANLIATPHRSREAPLRAAQLQRIFAGVPDVVICDGLPNVIDLGDEGAANHTRLTSGDHDVPGIHLFVHGRAHGIPADRLPQRKPTRQTLLASQAAARCLHLPIPRCVHARQTPQAVDAGAFHNDVVMAADRQRLLVHQHTLIDQDRVLMQLRYLIPDLRVAVVTDHELPLEAAVHSYLFNSQLLGDTLVAPAQCGEGQAAKVLQRLIDDGFLAKVVLVDLAQSMANGGGPACLRLRIPLRDDQIAALPRGICLNHQRLTALEAWVDSHYRETLHVTDLADPSLIDEHARALAALDSLLEGTAHP